MDDKGNEYGYSDPMPQETYRAQEIADRIAEATRNGLTPSPSDYDSMQKWHDAAQRKLAEEALPIKSARFLFSGEILKTTAQ